MMESVTARNLRALVFIRSESIRRNIIKVLQDEHVEIAPPPEVRSEMGSGLQAAGGALNRIDLVVADVTYGYGASDFWIDSAIAFGKPSFLCFSPHKSEKKPLEVPPMRRLIIYNAGESSCNENEVAAQIAEQMKAWLIQHRHEILRKAQ